ncbi:hypothetical protein ACHAXS_003985 [Conticribra weissflogii]
MTVKEFLSEEKALEECGNSIMDAGQEASRAKRLKKLQKEKKKEGKVDAVVPVTVGQITVGGNNDVFSLGILHGDRLLPSLRHLGQFKILREKPQFESSLVCNKKKCEVNIKFCVIPPSEDGNFDAVEESNSCGSVTVGQGDISKAMSKEIRIQAGLDYQVRMQQMALEKTALADAAAAAEVTNANDNATTENTNKEMVVTAFEVSGDIDYNKLIEKFGSKPLTPQLLKRLENVTVKRGTVDKLHRFLRREIFFSHRDLEKICELLEDWYGISPPLEDGDETNDTPMNDAATKPDKPCPFYLYTGRGPSSQAMHLGHLVPFLFTAWLQKAFQCPLVIQMTDDEKFLFKGTYSNDDAGDGTGSDPNRTGDNLDHFAKLTMENAKDIIACDFIPEKTFLFSDLDYVGRMYPNIVRIWKAITVNQVNGVFGFDASSNIGKVAFPAIQAAPSFGSSFPFVLNQTNGNNPCDFQDTAATLGCLIPCAIDQDPYFRLTRDIAHKLVPKHHPLLGKPSLIHSKFFPPLQGAQGKMSSSDANSAIFLTDTPEDIERKIKVHAFSGGRETKALQQELGADLEVDVSYQWLRFFLEDDEELERIGKEYGSGTGEFWSTGKVKGKLVEVLKELVGEHQERRRGISEEIVREWMRERCIL